MLLKDIIGETYHPKNKDEQEFWAKHKVELFQNKYSTAEYDPLFQGTKIKVSPREAERHGYSGAPSPKNPMDKSPEGNDEKHYEEVEVGGDIVEAEPYRSDATLNKRMMGGMLTPKQRKEKIRKAAKKVIKGVSKTDHKENDKPNPPDGGYV
jgi:hypothetical protein